MSLHQIIYTSCMRGINGVNDGQQVFSYDADFKDANNEDVKSLFSYTTPDLEPGVTMTEDLARTMPKSFTYRKTGNGMCALALSTYLGRDYMGSAGRFGNYLSHVVLASEEDMQHYPCEFFGSSVLRDHMEFEEVNNPNPPAFLPTPVLERGYRVDIDAVTEFLSIGDRIDTLKNMVHAVLSIPTEKKRVVICDEPENIILWIAAVEYTLPLKIALGLNFTTYAYDPSISSSQICGVLPSGSRYTLESRSRHFVFDLLQNSCASFEKDDHFFEFIDTAMSFSYDSLQDFHRFLTDGYTYNKADTDMYAAYRLYTLLSDGVSSMREEDIACALRFAQEYALPEEKQRIVQNLLGLREDLLQTNLSSFLFIMRHCLDTENLCDEDRNIISGIMVDRVLHEVLCNENGEAEFERLFGEVDSVCKENGFNLSTELMRKHNREKLFALMKNDIAKWKIAFIAKVVCSFVREQRVSVNDLMLETPLGQTYYALVHAIYPVNAQSGFYFVTRILDEFAFDGNYLVNMAFNLEGILYDVANGAQEIASMWKYFGQTMIKHHRDNLSAAYSVLNRYQRQEQIYMLYSLAMADAAGVSESKRIFTDHYDSFLSCDAAYAEKYGDKILTEYHRSIDGLDGEKAYDAKVKLFNIVTAEKKNVPFAEALVRDIIKPIPFESPSREDSRLIQISFDYLFNALRKPISGKLLFLVIGLVLEKSENNHQLIKSLPGLQRLTETAKADMSRINEHSTEKYFDWILPGFCEISETHEEMEILFSLFEMPSDTAELFFTTCAKIYLKRCKDDPSYKIFCEFLYLVFKRGNSQIREAVGKVLSKLSKQKLALLDNVVNDTYRSSKNARLHWDAIKKAAEDSTFFSSITNLFKRKKD